MSAARLREAAALMRSRAEGEGSRDWRKVDFNEGDGFPHRPLWGVANDAYFNPPADEGEPWLAVEVMTGTEATAEHITSWLAVADWLDDIAETWELFNSGAVPMSAWSMLWDTSKHKALAVADAYLGDPS